MGNGALNNSIGYGAATVINPNPAIQQFGNIVAQQRAEKSARDRELVNQMASLKSDAIRDADKEDYLAKYGDWKNAAIEANSLPRNSKQRLDALATAQQKYQDLGSYVASSKEQKQHENQLANMWLSNPHVFDDAAHKKFIKSMQSSMSTPDFVPHTKYGEFERYVDPKEISALLDNGKKKALADVIPERYQFPGTAIEGDKKGVYVQNRKQIPYEKVAENYLNLATIEPKFKKFLHDTYPDVESKTDQGALMERIHKLAEGRDELQGWNHADNKEFKANYAPDKFYEHRAYAEAHPTSNSNQLTPAQITVNNMKTGSPDAINHFLSLTPKKQYGSAKPRFEADPLTGEHVFVFPAQVVPDPKAIADNKKLRAEYERKPEKKGSILSFGGTPIPFEKSKLAAELKPEFKEKSPSLTYKLDPNDAEGYFGQAAQMAADQNIKLPQLNQLLGIKGKGLIAPIADAPKKKTVKLKIPDAKLY